MIKISQKNSSVDNIYITEEQWAKLPQEIFVHLFRDLETWDLGRSSLVSKTWKAMLDKDICWEKTLKTVNFCCKFYLPGAKKYPLKIEFPKELTPKQRAIYFLNDATRRSDKAGMIPKIAAAAEYIDKLNNDAIREINISFTADAALSLFKKGPDLRSYRKIFNAIVIEGPRLPLNEIIDRIVFIRDREQLTGFYPEVARDLCLEELYDESLDILFENTEHKYKFQCQKDSLKETMQHLFTYLPLEFKKKLYDKLCNNNFFEQPSWQEYFKYKHLDDNELDQFLESCVAKNELDVLLRYVDFTQINKYKCAKYIIDQFIKIESKESLVEVRDIQDVVFKIISLSFKYKSYAFIEEVIDLDVLEKVLEDLRMQLLNSSESLMFHFTLVRIKKNDIVKLITSFNISRLNDIFWDQIIVEGGQTTLFNQMIETYYISISDLKSLFLNCVLSTKPKIKHSFYRGVFKDFKLDLPKFENPGSEEYHRTIASYLYIYNMAPKADSIFLLDSKKFLEDLNAHLRSLNRQLLVPLQMFIQKHCLTAYNYCQLAEQVIKDIDLILKAKKTGK